MTARARQFYKSIRWGNEPNKVLNLDDYELLPEWTAVLGRPDRLATPAFDPSSRSLNKGWLLADPSRRRELFVVGIPAPRGRFPTAKLWEIAQYAGGRRAGYPYPDVVAKDLGPLFHIDYLSQKGGNELVRYVHEVLDRGEGKKPAKFRPHLAYAEGVFFIVGGDYTVTGHGIVG